MTQERIFHGSNYQFNYPRWCLVGLMSEPTIKLIVCPYVVGLPLKTNYQSVASTRFARKRAQVKVSSPHLYDAIFRVNL